MGWKVQYLPEVQSDLDSLGKADARKALKVIDERIINGEPEKAGRSLGKNLVGCRRIRTGDIRIVYKMIDNEVQVLIIAVGPRRNNEVYDRSGKRVSDKKEQQATAKKSVSSKRRKSRKRS